MAEFSRYIERSEIACSCGCGLDSMDKETIVAADDALDHCGPPIRKVTGCRCYPFNRSIGSNDTSQHPKCRALDIPHDNPLKLYNYLCEKYNNKYGIGLYDTFVHFDTATNGPKTSHRSARPARWDMRSKK